MQEPLNFSCSAAYLATQALAARFLNSLRTHSGGVATNSDFSIDLHRGCLSDGDATVLLSNPWVASPSNTEAAMSLKTTSMTNSAPDGLREATSIKSFQGTGTPHPAFEKVFSNNTGTTDLYHSVSENSANYRLLHPVGNFINENSCATSQASRRTSKAGERGRRSRVVIHQFGDEEDHFSKSLRDLHFKSAGDPDDSDDANQQKCVWALMRTIDDDLHAKASLLSPFVEAQNIADLAVEKHFEKSLAIFYAKQAASTAAAAALESSSTELPPCKTSLDLTEMHLSPSSSSSFTNSSSEASALFSPRDESCGPPFNPKKKWLAQYGDDEGARIGVGIKSRIWSVDDNRWNYKEVASSTKTKKRSKSCPLLHSQCTHPLKVFSPLKQNPKLKLKQNFERAEKSLIHLLQLHQRRFSTMIPSLIDFFDEDEAMVAHASLVSPSIPTSSCFFTDSTCSLDSSTLPCVNESQYYSSNASITSIFKARHLAALKGSSKTTGESDYAMGPNEPNFNGSVWLPRKRTASDVSGLACLKRSRSVTAADYAKKS